ncbi:substrate-binding domain-containing protein [Vibrio viridaestus]|uniref:substrate-binding domain-containing protein n=1 Tax=Vibrio viridaestus TaxID=2487322 RepID=UPI003F6E219C
MKTAQSINQSEQNSDVITRNFQNTVSSNSKPTTLNLDDKVKIALIYPSADISDFWIRNYKALIKRLNELNIPYEIQEFSSRQIEHALQTKYIDDVLDNASSYDFVIFGPSELEVQSKNIQKLSKSTEFKTFIWAFHTPNPSWHYTPDAWFDFSSSMGAQVLCHYLIEDLGTDVNFALNRGIPGVTDDQRSQEFSDCVEENGNWLNMYEHFGQYQKKGGEDGAKLIVKNFPEVTMLHNANTAMTMGAIDALTELGKVNDIFITGWGGTAKEVEKIKEGVLNATPMRMSDDVGVATAEAIKYYLEGRADQVPTIYLGRITVASSKMSPEQLEMLSQEAFRYSGE